MFFSAILCLFIGWKMPLVDSLILDIQNPRCGRKALPTAGMVLECNYQGTLLTVRRDDLGLLHGIAPGLPFHYLVGRGSLDKAFAFLTELKKRGSALGWKLQVSLTSHPTMLYVGGVVKNGLLLIFGTRTRGGLLRFSQSFLDKTGAEAKSISDPSPLSRILNESELALQEQLSATQTQLANLKRALARKSVRLQRVIAELQTARSGLHTLRKLLPICSSCKKIRDEQGNWQQIEPFFKSRAGVRFTHSICPECVENLYPDISLEK
jgi:hypothetical protein